MGAEPRDVGTNSLTATPTTLYVPTKTDLYALDPATGTTKWQIPNERVRGYVIPRPQGSSTDLYYTDLYYVAGTSPSAVVRRADLGTSYQDPPTFLTPLPGTATATSLIMSSGVVYVGGSDGNLYGVDRNGTIIGSKPLGGGMVGTPTIDVRTERLLVSTERGLVVAYPLPVF